MNERKNERANERTNERKKKTTKERRKERTSERTIERLNKRTNERTNKYGALAPDFARPKRPCVRHGENKAKENSLVPNCRGAVGLN